MTKDEEKQLNSLLVDAVNQIEVVMTILASEAGVNEFSIDGRGAYTEDNKRCFVSQLQITDEGTIRRIKLNIDRDITDRKGFTDHFFQKAMRDHKKMIEEIEE